MTEDNIRVLWLRPSTGENVSVRRERIAEHLEEKGVDVTICDASGLDGAGAIKEAFDGTNDLIIGNVRIGLYLGYLLSRALRKPLIGDVSDPITDIDHLPQPIYKALRSFEWWILKRSSASFFVESNSFEAAKRKGIDPLLARNAVDYGTFHDPSDCVIDESKAVFEEAGIIRNKPIAIYIGSLVPHYHISEIIESATATPDWNFVFIGEDRGVNIEQRVSSIENSHFLGSFEYKLIPGFLHHCSAGICLVDKEQPLKVLEYGAAGLPTLGYPGKLRNNFSNSELVYTDTNPEAISEALERISAEPDWADRVGSNLQKRAKDHSWKAIAEKYYDQITAIADAP